MAHVPSSPERATRRRRKVSRDLTPGAGPVVRVLDVEAVCEGTGKKHGGRFHQRMVTLGSLSITRGSSGTVTNDPSYAVASRISEALDPSKAPGKVRTLADMSEEEKEALAKEYGAPIKVRGGR